jgi:glutamate/tyrosine decarboxylase-like PLP-dependent enzyme
MSAPLDAYRGALEQAREHAYAWLDSVPARRVAPTADADELAAVFGGPLPDTPSDPAEVVGLLARSAEPGLMAMQSGRFFGWVIGGTLPAALGADWLVSAWDQNSGMRFASPAVAAAEEAAGAWLLDLLGLPAQSDVGFTTGATMANFTGLAAGRQHACAQAGWDLDTHGLASGPKVSVFVGADRHAVIDLALKYLGLGAPVVVETDREGRILPLELARAMEDHPGPGVVCLQAGNLHSGASDPMRDAIAVARSRDAWVHVDGAFGLWAAASPRFRSQLDGVETADSWATDAHKTLNVPYDCGIVVVSRPAVLRQVFGTHTSYLMAADVEHGDPHEKVPELSRRARGVPVWAALRSLGRSGAAALVEGLADSARALADGLERIPGTEILNEVVFTQVCVSFGTDQRTREVTQRLLADGTTWMSGSRWRDRDVLRISVSNWATDEEDVRKSIAAVARAAAETP